MSRRLTAAAVVFAFVTLAGWFPGIAGGRAGAAEILFVGGGANPPSSSDQAIITRLMSQGHNVRFVEALASTTADSAGKQLVVISSTVPSGDVGTKFTDVPAGVINWEQALWDELLLGGNGGNPANQSEITIRPENASHPLAAGLATGTHIVYSLPQTMSLGAQPLGPGAIHVADATGLPAIVGYD